MLYLGNSEVVVVILSPKGLQDTCLITDMNTQTLQTMVTLKYLWGFECDYDLVGLSVIILLPTKITFTD